MTENNQEKTIGVRIKEQRKRKNFNLEDLSSKTGLTKSFLSQVERGLVSTSINSLRKIAEALDVSILYFFEDKHKYDLVARAGTRPKISLPGLSEIIYEVITANLGQKVEVYLGKLSPGKSYDAEPLRVPPEECIYVLSGSLKVALDQDCILNPGDSICFQGSSLKGYACVSEVETSWIAIITPPVF
jgi:transcriptional regulator with XRE-family HTH domain